MRTPPAVAALSAAALLIGAAACGDDGGGDAAPYVDALVAEFESGGDFPFETEQARCLAEGFVDTVGVDQLEERDITPQELADSGDPRQLGIELGEEEADGFADTIRDCDLSVGELFLAGSRQSGTEIPEGLSECIDDNVDEDAFYDLIAQSIIGQEQVDEAEANALFADAREACPGFTEIVG